MLISPLVFSLIIQERFQAALVWFIIASLTDFLDGEIARRKNVSSHFGEWLDPIADKILTLFSLSALLLRGFCPTWFVALMVTLSVFQLCGAVLLKTFRPLAVTRFQPTLLARIGSALLRVWVGWTIFNLVPGAVINHMLESHLSHAETLVWGILAGLHVVTFIQYFQRSASQLLPRTILRR